MPKRGLPETVRMRHDEHYVEALTSSAGSADRPDGADRPDRSEPEPAAPGHGRPVGADGVDRRERHHRADHRPAARAAVPDRRRRAPLPGGGPGRPAGNPDRHPRGGRQRDHRDRADREHPAEGPDARSKRPRRCTRWPTRCGYTHEDMARRLGKSRTSITESLVAEQHARRGQKPLSAGRHSLQVVAFTDS